MKSRQRSLILVLILVSIFLFFWKLGELNFVDEDEAMYAQVAQEMLTRGDWVYPHLNNWYWIDKPLLVPWAIALSFKIMGRSELAIRTWHSIVGLLCVLLVYFFGKELFDKKTGFFSALILASCLQFFYQARITLCDIPLTFFITLSLYLFLLFIRRRNVIFYYASVVSMSFATLVKGPVGVVLPVIIIITYLLCTKKKILSRMGKLHISAGMALFFAIVAPWFIAQTLRYGKEFVDKYFFYKHVQRILHPIDVVSPTKKPDPFYSYVLIIAAGFIPWSGALFHGMGCMLRRVWKDRNENEMFLIIWSGVIFVLFSVVGMKVPRYIMPVYPAAAIITGRFFASMEGRKWVSFLLSFVLAPFLLAAVIFAAKQYHAVSSPYISMLLPSVVILGIGIGGASFLFFLKDKKFAFSTFLLAGIAGYAALIFYSGKHFNTLRPSKRFASSINSLAAENDRILDYRPPNPEPSLIFYTNRHIDFIYDEDQLVSVMNSEARVFCVIPSGEAESLGRKVSFYMLDESAGRMLVTNKFVRFKA